MKSLHRITLLTSIAIAHSAMAQTSRPSDGTADDSPPAQTRSERTTGTADESATTPPNGPAGLPATSLPKTDTAADRTAPADRQRAGGALHPELVGAQVVSPGKAPIGEVVDVVFDSRGQPDYIVIASEGRNTALPYRMATSMMERGKVIVDEAKLRSAPELEQEQWRTQHDGEWRAAATDYWDEG